MYSTYEAKAKLSEILRQVREGKTITISYHGEPVAEIRPLEKKQTFEERWQELIDRGVVTPAKGPKLRFEPIAHVPGALQRFLDDRD